MEGVESATSMLPVMQANPYCHSECKYPGQHMLVHD